MGCTVSAPCRDVTSTCLNDSLFCESKTRFSKYAPWGVTDPTSNQSQTLKPSLRRITFQAKKWVAALEVPPLNCIAAGNFLDFLN